MTLDIEKIISDSCWSLLKLILLSRRFLQKYSKFIGNVLNFIFFKFYYFFENINDKLIKLIIIKLKNASNKYKTSK